MTLYQVFRNLLILLIKWLDVQIQFLEKYIHFHKIFLRDQIPLKFDQVVFCRKSAISLQLYQKETTAQLFSCNFCEFFQNTRWFKSCFTVAFFLQIILTQLTFTFSKSTMETLVQGVKYVQTLLTFFWCFYC